MIVRQLERPVEPDVELAAQQKLLECFQQYVGQRITNIEIGPKKEVRVIFENSDHFAIPVFPAFEFGIMRRSPGLLPVAPPRSTPGD